MAETADAALEPILIAGALAPPAANGAHHVALADGEWREEALTFDRVFFLFDNSRIDDARATWRKLGAAEGVERHFWKQDDRGRWSERSEEHTSELQSLMRIAYAVFCLKKKKDMYEHNQ